MRLLIRQNYALLPAPASLSVIFLRQKAFLSNKNDN